MNLDQREADVVELIRILTVTMAPDDRPLSDQEQDASLEGYAQHLRELGRPESEIQRVIFDAGYFLGLQDDSLDDCHDCQIEQIVSDFDENPEWGIPE